MADKVIEARVIQKIATETEWMLVDRVLYKGEIALVSNGSRVNNIKVGDGSNYFSELPYIYKGGFSGSVDRSTDGSTVLDGFYIAKEPGVYYSLGNLLVRENTFTVLQKELGVWSIASETPLPTLDDYINPTQFALIDAFFTPNYLGDYNKIKWNSFKINHFAIESNMREWNILGGEFTTPTTNAYCIYLKCNKSNNEGEVYITTAQIDTIQTDYYYFLIGVINSYQPSLGAREVSMLQGFSMMSGSFVKTGRIISNDGSTYFDLDNGEFKGKFTFTNGESVEEAITNQEIYIEYSQNGIDWHSTFLYDDVFMRQKKGDGAWSNAIRIVGIQGIKGDKGADGQTQYVHIRYSANSDGSSMTTTPQENTAYIGLVTTTSSVAPTSNTSYTWSLIKGEQGVPGIPGADGSSLFTWVKYADTPTSGMSDYPDDKLYIGLAYNKVTATESNNYNDYSWSLMPQNIEIGGRNLILNSKLLEGRTDFYGGLTTAVMPLSIKLEKDKEYIFIYKNNNEKPRAEINTITLRNSKGETVQEITTKGDGSETIFKVNVEGVVGIAFYSVWKNAFFSFRELMFTSGNKIVDWTPAPEDVEASILQSKTDSINASKAYSDAQDELERIQTQAYADGKVTAAEQRAIDDATAKAEAAKIYAKAQDDLLRTQLEAYADGVVTAEEQERTQQMQDNLAAAKAYADAQANLAKIAANAYADGVVDEEEARAIADATAKMEAAKLHAQGLVNNIQIGGRNLLLNSKSLEGLTDIYGGVGSAVIPLSVKLEKDKEYIFTYKNNNDIPRAEINTITLRNANGETIQEIQTIGDGSPTIFKVNVEGVVGIYFYSLWKNANFSFRELMFTSGNKIVDWTPAPEDVDNAINDVKIKAENALTQLTSIANDNVLSQSEKQQISNEWNRIKSEYTSNYSLGVSNGVSTTNLTNAYNDLFNYITPLLVDISTESQIVGDVFRAKFKAYYDQNIALLVAINDKIKQGINNNANNITNLSNSIARINQVTSFLNTTVNGNVIGTGVLMVGSEAQSNAGISGLNEAGSKSVRLWAGGTAQNRDKANWVMLDDGTERTFHSNGNLASERGLVDGSPIFNFYHKDGYLLFKLDPNRGLVNVAYTNESWSERRFYQIPVTDFNASDDQIRVYLTPLITQSNGIYSIEKNKLNYQCWEYFNGTIPSNADLQQYNGYKTNNTEKIGNNISNGWYLQNYGPLEQDFASLKHSIAIVFIENGIERQNRIIVMTNI